MNLGWNKQYGSYSNGKGYRLNITIINQKKSLVTNEILLDQRWKFKYDGYKAINITRSTTREAMERSEETETLQLKYDSYNEDKQGGQVD